MVVLTGSGTGEEELLKNCIYIYAIDTNPCSHIDGLIGENCSPKRKPWATITKHSNSVIISSVGADLNSLCSTTCKVYRSVSEMNYKNSLSAPQKKGIYKKIKLKNISGKTHFSALVIASNISYVIVVSD